LLFIFFFLSLTARTDNRGPPLSSDEVRNEWKALQLEFPGVEIISSTFDDFVTSIEHVPDALFPQIDSEIADTWIYVSAWFTISEEKKIELRLAGSGL
jgi:hypothetical protein